LKGSWEKVGETALGSLKAYDLTGKRVDLGAKREMLTPGAKTQGVSRQGKGLKKGQTKTTPLSLAGYKGGSSGLDGAITERRIMSLGKKQGKTRSWHEKEPQVKKD